MKNSVAVVALCLAATPALAQKACEELRAEIAAKIEAKGVKNYHLDIMAAEAVKGQKVVGSCEGGKKRITYRRD